MLGRFAGAE
jgi:hypothetical protein